MSNAQRQTDANVNNLFTDRWSPRSFSDQPVTQEQLDTVFEAARWSPSCFNEQPWLFHYATEDPDLAAFRELVMDGNRAWADAAPVVGFVLAKKTFEKNGNPNRWNQFDVGAASLALALQAQMLGLSVHFMGGIHADKVPGVLGVDPDAYDVMAGFVIGHRGPADALPENFREREVPSPRKPLGEIAVKGRAR